MIAELGDKQIRANSLVNKHYIICYDVNHYINSVPSPSQPGQLKGISPNSVNKNNPPPRCNTKVQINICYCVKVLLLNRSSDFVTLKSIMLCTYLNEFYVYDMQGSKSVLFNYLVTCKKGFFVLSVHYVVLD